jgi:hypothetical protein
MTRWKYAAVITFVLGSVGVSYLLRSTKTSPAAAPAVPKSLGCRFAVGDTLATSCTPAAVPVEPPPATGEVYSSTP